MASYAPSMTIRSARRSDLPAFKRIIDATGLFPSEMLDDMAADIEAIDGDERWLATLADGDEDTAPIALAYCTPERMTDGTWNLLLIAVHPEHQGRGVGRALMTHVEGLLAAQGVRVLLVETSGTDEFDRTRAFYRGLDYDEEARIRDYYAAGDDKIVFRKAL